MGEKSKGDNVEVKEITKKVIVKVMELLEAEASRYEWGSDEEEALGDILGQLDDLRRS